jgi:hypothetical protein
MLGGTSSSRLFQEVRERRGLAYSVFSYSNLYAHTGEVGLYVGTRPENLAEALTVVAGRARALCGGPASEEELTARGEPQGPRRARARVDRRAHEPPRRVGLNGLPILSVDEMIERIDAVTPSRSRARSSSCSRRPLSRGGRRPDEQSFRAAIEPLLAAGVQRRRRSGGRAVIRVAVAGAAGRMGQTVCEAVRGRGDMELVGRADPALGTTLADVLGDARSSSTSPSRTRRSRTRSRASRPACTS